jgi:LacI family transcriptional regulator
MVDMSSQKPPKARPTLKTLSAMTGLSMSTVSLALRGGENLRDETRQRIHDAARKIGYEPDRAGVRLRTGKTGTIALILDGSEDSVGFSRKLIAGIHDGLRGRGFTLNVLPQFDRAESEQTLGRIVRAQLADGVILTHTEPMDRRVSLLTESGVPFVTHGRTEFYTDHPYHDFDIESFVRIGLERLAALGARQVAAVIVDNPTTCSHIMRRCLLAGAAELGMAVEFLIDRVPGEGHLASLRDQGRALAARADRPDAILSDSEIATISLASGLRDGGVVLGRDMFIVSKQTSDLLRTLFPEIDSLEERVQASGQELARLLMSRLDGDGTDKLQTLAEPVIHFNELAVPKI